MAKDPGTARRVRVERNIYRRPSGVYEVGFKDAVGKQRWRTVEGGITAARALRDELLTRRNRGEQIVPDGRLRLADAAAKWLDGPVRELRQAGFSESSIVIVVGVANGSSTMQPVVSVGVA